MKKRIAINNLVLTQHFHELGANLSSPFTPKGISHPQLVKKSHQTAQLLGLSCDVFDSLPFLSVFSGNAVLKKSNPIAQAYAGHQFGNFNPFLGDGRAVLLGEITTNTGRWSIGIKGVGQTPYCFASDGRASIDECLHEFFMSERLASMNVPTMRSLCVVQGRETVYRSGFKSVGMLTRVAPSFIRFGSFEYCYFKKDYNALKVLADYVIEGYFVDCLGENRRHDYVQFFSQVVKNTAALIARWQNVGFVHGMMNTDNQSIHGVTLDLGESMFLDDREKQSAISVDDEHGRYDFNQQPIIGLWNCNVLARALSPLISSKDLKKSLSIYEATYLDCLHG